MHGEHIYMQIASGVGVAYKNQLQAAKELRKACEGGGDARQSYTNA
jgi:hypothetical protein